MSDDGADRSPDYESAGAEVPATDDDDFGMVDIDTNGYKVDGLAQDDVEMHAQDDGEMYAQDDGEMYAQDDSKGTVQDDAEMYADGEMYAQDDFKVTAQDDAEMPDYSEMYAQYCAETYFDGEMYAEDAAKLALQRLCVEVDPLTVPSMREYDRWLQKDIMVNGLGISGMPDMTEAFELLKMPLGGVEFVPSECTRASESFAEETVDKWVETNIQHVTGGADSTLYKHKNAYADGRCSIYATGDILGLSIDDTVAAFDDFVMERRQTAEEQLSFVASHPDVCAYFASQRQTSATYLSDDHLLTRYQTSMREETENLGHLLENVRQLHAGWSQ
jgi:hypothetical protein